MIRPNYSWIHAARMAAVAITDGKRTLDMLPEQTKIIMLNAALDALPREFSSVQSVVTEDAYAEMHEAACRAGAASLQSIDFARRLIVSRCKQSIKMGMEL